eukprot:TRINITY_DN1222_c0_g1_i12.p1 TRINITY_DN1222_c0_g1~~TRINITY_DN1222_c0_g1_i12.p1  ORF type:complete len:490 (-),score=77.98 TRINITY_DN1222_c0_g1_i12:303-1772(-)
MVFLPMSYIYGGKYVYDGDDLIDQLKDELYGEGVYDTIRFSDYRLEGNDIDDHSPPSWYMKAAFQMCSIYEKLSGWIPKVRGYCMDKVLDHIRFEDRFTNYICIGPVNKAINMLCEFYASDGQSLAFQQHQERIYDYLWLSRDGMKMQGYNGSQLWDTAFMLQAMLELDQHLFRFESEIEKAADFIYNTQVLENLPGYKSYYRHQSQGAWPFSTRTHGWPISDCTAEGLRCCLLLRDIEFVDNVEISRLEDAVDVILSLQNADGGWASYENKRGGDWVELFNPVSCFEGIMVDYSYCECSSACIQSLCLWREMFPEYRSEDIDTSIKNGLNFLKSIAREDGSWVGSWAVCFTYAIWFGVEAFVAAGKPNSKYVQRACQFLLEKQADDGSWGESIEACKYKTWINLEEGHYVQTSWALLALMATENIQHYSAIEKGIQFLISNQLVNGDWMQQSVTGVFNFTCSISYSGYKNVFPIWALARWNKFQGIQF